MNRIRVLIVDDSATMRSLIAAVLRRDPEIDVVGQAASAAEARTAIKALEPDVVTLDIEMPNMNGLDFLEKIMRLHPMPVVMVSSHTRSGAEATMEALSIGAVDCVAKPAGADVSGGFAHLADKVKAAARARVSALGSRPAQPSEALEAFSPNGMLVAIGASAGGVEAIQAVISGFPENCPPTVIAQHMPASFTAGFAERLNRLCAAKVEEASDGAVLEPGRIYIAPGARHLEVAMMAGVLRCRLRPEDFTDGPKPSVDVLMSSVAAVAGVRSVGVILTGMGRDGAQGLLAMRQRGARTFAQNQASSVIYGMPRAAVEAGAVERELSLEQVTTEVLKLCNAERGRLNHARGG
jgi:two-component system, chemotaxis family, protein-glutamate methylesterase/glutaminase